MRIALISDVHSNLAALEAVLTDAERGGALDAVWCMGDLVGYGPQPREVLKRLREYDFHAVAGNHDLAVVGEIDTGDFNEAAAVANAWNAKRATKEDHAYLKSLPLTDTCGALTLVHGSLRAPVWEYMFSVQAAVAQFARMQFGYCMVGHTHVPLLFAQASPDSSLEHHLIEHNEVVPLGATRLILNPGSVGQPRDGDPRAAYAVYEPDDARITFLRVAYDIGRTQRAMRKAKLPAPLIKRLERGR